jgi:membrane-bound serine protease (ClpP class)
MMPSGWFISFRVMAIGVGLVGAGFMVIVLTGIIRLRRLKPVQGKDEFTHLQGQVITPLQPEGQIKIKGEIWRAISKNGNTIPKGQAIRVVSREGMVLIVEPLEYTGEESKH